VKPIEYVIGDATQPKGDGVKIIAHIVNDTGVWARGFVLALSARWHNPETCYRGWAKGEYDQSFKLGQVQLIEVAPSEQIWVANMLAQHGRFTTAGVPPIRYVALKDCLEHLAASALSRKASVHMPRIGCGLAGGKWDIVGPMVEECLARLDIPVTVYDLPS
jgi:O-acetyl-ADP-ribose deacetylase (regulator of RNase III)